MTASPTPTAVTNPSELKTPGEFTVATFSSLLSHIKLRRSAFSGIMCEVNNVVEVLSNDNSSALKVTDEASLCLSVTLHVAITPEPSLAVAVITASP